MHASEAPEEKPDRKQGSTANQWERSGLAMNGEWGLSERRSTKPMFTDAMCSLKLISAGVFNGPNVQIHQIEKAMAVNVSRM